MPENIINKKHGIVKNEPCYKFCVKSVLLPERFGVSLAPSASGFDTGCLQKFNLWLLLHKLHKDVKQCICFSTLKVQSFKGFSSRAGVKFHGKILPAADCHHAHQ